jgi:hypothetical protein
MLFVVWDCRPSISPVRDRSALPRRWSHACISRNLSPVAEISEQPLRPQNRAELRPDALDVEQHRRRRSGAFSGKQGIPLDLHHFDLREQQFQAIELKA